MKNLSNFSDGIYKGSMFMRNYAENKNYPSGQTFFNKLSSFFNCNLTFRQFEQSYFVPLMVVGFIDDSECGGMATC